MKSIQFIPVIFFIFLILASGCSSQKDPQKIMAEIEKNKEKIREINNTIKTLEEQLNDTVIENKFNNKIYVKTEKLQYKEFNHYIEVKGIVEAVQDAFISPQMSGQIKAIYVKEGDRVKKGDLLATLNANVTEKGIEEIKTALELATTTFEKQKELWEQKIGSEIQFLQAKNTKESLERKLETLQAQKEMSMIFAPFDGIVDGVFQKVGELGTPGMRMMQLVNLNELYINAAISEDYLPVIHKGEVVELSFPTYPDLKLKAEIYRIGNVINSQNRTFEIKIKIKNIEEKLKPNMLAVLKINDYTEEKALILPSIIIKQDLKGKYVYKVSKRNNELIAEKVYIETGKSYEGNSMIVKGVSVNDNIIIEGYNIVTNGSEIRLN